MFLCIDCFTGWIVGPDDLRVLIPQSVPNVLGYRYPRSFQYIPLLLVFTKFYKFLRYLRFGLGRRRT